MALNCASAALSAQAIETRRTAEIAGQTAAVLLLIDLLRLPGYRQIASEMEGSGKSVATREGAIIMPPSSPLTRTACPSIFVFLRRRTGLSIKRKFITGRVIL